VFANPSISADFWRRGRASQRRTEVLVGPLVAAEDALEAVVVRQVVPVNKKGGRIGKKGKRASC